MSMETAAPGLARAETPAASMSFERFGAICAIIAGVAGFLYSLAFVVLARPGTSTGEMGVTIYSLAQLIGGLATTAVLVVLYDRLREVDHGFSLWGLLVGLVAAFGSAIHGGYTLANIINQPATDPIQQANLPFSVDPRGLMTFGVTGLALFVFSWLMSRSGRFPRALSYLGYALAALMVIIYLGRLIVLDADNPVLLVPAAIAGFIVNPAWFVWLGMSLMRKS
jgi:hypothetical protein